MGCWNETCAVTHLPIFHEDPVFMILLTEKGIEWNWWQDPIWLDQTIESCGPGTYDNYGWIDEIKKEEDSQNHLRSLFIRLEVWEKLQNLLYDDFDSKRFFGFIKHHFDVEDGTTTRFGLPNKRRPSDEITKLCIFANRCRLNLNVGLSHKGSQNGDLEEYKRYVELIQLGFVAIQKRSDELDQM
jgi:hypothetical protein